MEKWIHQLTNIGTYGPIIMIVIAIWQLYYLPKYLIWFLVFLWVNESIIIFAKQIIKQPRPVQPLLNDYPTRPDYVLPGFSLFQFQIGGHDYYGMPSGHAQHALFIMSFLWLVNPSWAVLCLCMVITGIIFMERYTTNRHSIDQLLVGGISGMALAYVSVMILRKYYEYY